MFDEKIRSFLRAHVNRPFLLYHPSQLPHGPVSIPEIDPAVTHISALTQYEKEYASMVLRLDHTVGMMLDELRRLGIEDNTMIVFCSDNGHAVTYKERGRCEPDTNLHTSQHYDNVTTKFYSALSGDVFNGNDGMAGLKFSHWEGGVRLPFLVQWPGVIEPGRVSTMLVANYDFLPTIADVLGVPVPPGKDGLSFLPELQGASERQPQHEHIVFASGLGPALVSRDGWKLRQVTLPKQNLYQLYHLPSDYREERNLVHEQRDVVERLGAALLRACDGSFLNGTPAAHQVWFPGINFHGPDCYWDMAP